MFPTHLISRLCYYILAVDICFFFVSSSFSVYYLSPPFLDSIFLLFPFNIPESFLLSVTLVQIPFVVRVVYLRIPS